ncbi:hypothetical protein H8356DRAFT_583956 [Neocallimastix lanati (nom. inval.)]|jgi:hypothetical protein|uniref:Uncharacterized protein n=1 Tax=Neocallimastix californiae TaxID=1754190 RepID=A0A1Y2BT95_9FUNG|nr:hypothetical protein H8356DRAFT_583956 [Neocallimastix sp. JGI-2020a]ORY37355.1 hypothetical protein LY90DRAFT_704677 [Neocallimastix californiae]|eukprot:ORY37355.1 hypothetical protein LY90DRAFT_704677 [Neocallimastix californiae]
MKFFAYGSVLALAITNALGLSIKCMLESAKYGSCVAEIKNFPDVTKPETMQEFCESLKKDGCKSFVADAGVTTTSCDINDENDKELANLIYTARIGYLAYCVTDKDGNQCPLSSYLLKQNSGIKGERSLDQPTQEELSIFLEDCKKDECNDRLVKLIGVTKAYSTAKGQDVNSIVPPEYDAILEDFKNKKCEEVAKLAGVNITTTESAAAPSATAAANANTESSATTLKAISSTISLVALLAIVLF